MQVDGFVTSRELYEVHGMKERVRRFMREHDLQAPHRAGHALVAREDETWALADASLEFSLRAESGPVSPPHSNPVLLSCDTRISGQLPVSGNRTNPSP